MATQNIQNPDKSYTASAAGTTLPTTAYSASGGTTATPLNSTVLTSQAPIVPAPAPQPTMPNIGGASATMAANNASLAPAPTLPDTSGNTSDIQDQLNKILGSESTPSTANADAYKNTYGVTPEQAKIDQQTAQTNLNTQNAAVQAAQEKYNALDAQIKGLDYQSSAVIPAQDQQNAAGRGITTGGLAPITAAEQRAVLLQKAPLQYSALLAQSELANAQGKATLAKGILDQANSHLDELFKAQTTDIANNVAHQKDAFDKIWSYLTEAEKLKAADIKAATAANQTQANNFVNDVQSAIQDAVKVGDTATAGALAKLGTVSLLPTSQTFAQDFTTANSQLATLKAKIPALSAIDTQIKQGQIKVQNSNLATDVLQRQNIQSNLKTAELTRANIASEIKARENPILKTFTQTEQNTLGAVGIQPTVATQIASYVKDYGLQAFLTTNAKTITSDQKDALNKIYGTNF